jgi:hypothetical protein
MRECWLCGSTYWIESHHVFGASNKKNSEKFGLVVDLCHFCHNEPPNGIHFNRENELRLKREFQQKFEDEHPGESFLKIFGKNYL